MSWLRPPPRPVSHTIPRTTRATCEKNLVDLSQMILGTNALCPDESNPLIRSYRRAQDRWLGRWAEAGQ